MRRERGGMPSRHHRLVPGAISMSGYGRTQFVRVLGRPYAAVGGPGGARYHQGGGVIIGGEDDARPLAAEEVRPSMRW
jgi:hypothetical protein